ncbi:MAG TPA: hypothetical protein PKD85_16850, partial [Saprospiraceae bacterium]|nr:hypothetical protein [Saprospiraceae bacterium]
MIDTFDSDISFKKDSLIKASDLNKLATNVEYVKDACINKPHGILAYKEKTSNYTIDNTYINTTPNATIFQLDFYLNESRYIAVGFHCTTLYAFAGTGPDYLYMDVNIDGTTYFRLESEVLLSLSNEYGGISFEVPIINILSKGYHSSKIIGYTKYNSMDVQITAGATYPSISWARDLGNKVGG